MMASIPSSVIRKHPFSEILVRDGQPWAICLICSSVTGGGGEGGGGEEEEEEGEEIVIKSLPVNYLIFYLILPFSRAVKSSSFNFGHF